MSSAVIAEGGTVPSEAIQDTVFVAQTECPIWDAMVQEYGEPELEIE